MIIKPWLFQIPQRYRFSSKSQPYYELPAVQRCCFRYHKGTDFQANHNTIVVQKILRTVVLDTTKVQIFKQITTGLGYSLDPLKLFQIPQRYRFSSKSQLTDVRLDDTYCCFRYHKGTDFQANHNTIVVQKILRTVVLDTTKVQIFKQITTGLGYSLDPLKLFQIPQRYRFSSKSQLTDVRLDDTYCCFRYHKGTDFQANHNYPLPRYTLRVVVLDTTKVQIFKQITTKPLQAVKLLSLFQIPQRYRFSSKSQLSANIDKPASVVLDTTKVQIFKQITTASTFGFLIGMLFQIPQRYRFSSKSQHALGYELTPLGCFRYHKGTDFQANHNLYSVVSMLRSVVLDTTKVQIFFKYNRETC